MKRIFLNMAIIIAGLSLFVVGCDDNIDPLVTEVKTDRTFSPTSLEARVTNNVDVQITWDAQEDIESYSVLFIADSVENLINVDEQYLLENAFETVENISPEELPFVYKELPGQSDITAFVKAYSSIGLTDSKWSGVNFKTKKENIFLDPVIGGQQVTLNWPAGTAATQIVITDVAAESSTTHVITAEEKAAGSATITGLEFDTAYDAVIFNGDNERGNMSFSTLPDGILVQPGESIEDAIALANEGDAILLAGGLFTESQGTITVDKNITIIAYKSDERPTLNATFVIGDGVTDGVTISGIDFYAKYKDAEGDQVLTNAVQIQPTDGTALGDITIENCTFRGHDKSFIAASSGAFSVKSVTVDNCIIDSISGSGGDMIDFRKSFAEFITLKNSTFSNCSLNGNQRQFVRFDGADKGPNTYDDGAHTPTVEINSCTFYNVLAYEASSRQQFTYVRWINSEEVIISKNNLFYNLGTSTYGRDSRCETTKLTFENNNYVNADGMFDSTMKVYDSSSYRTIDPKFTDAPNGNFTVNDEKGDLKAYGIGDPRWRQ